MLKISHRGNTSGPREDENSPDLVEEVTQEFTVEVDLWKIGPKLFLGHNGPQYEITWNFLTRNRPNLLVHCKNVDALQCMGKDFHYFWHEKDKYTLTSQGIILAYPGQDCPLWGIAMKCENWSQVNKNWYGICSDYISYFNN